MALIRCPECDREVSDMAKTCPHCGFPLHIIENVEQPKSDGVHYARPSGSLPKREEEKNPKRTIFWIVLIVIGMFVGCGSCMGGSNDEEVIVENAAELEEGVVVPEKSDQAVVEKVNIFENELEEYTNGEYHYITCTDLVKYHTNIEGMNFYTVAEVNEFEDSVIKISLDDGYMMSVFNCRKDYSDFLEEEQNIAIMGIVADYNDYGAMGKSIKFTDCMVFAVGEDAKQYDLGISDEYFNEHFIVTDEVANSSSDITEAEYKSICEKLDYEDILRNPDSYNNSYCKIDGNVEQIIEGWLGTYTIFVDDFNGNTWGCVYSYDDGEEHLLEGDSVTVYGECNGTSTTETVLGKQVTLPYVEVEYIE